MSQRRRGGKRVDALGIGILVTAALVFAGIFAASQLGTGRLEANFCESSGPSGLLVLGIDATDLLSAPQRMDVRNRLEREISDVLPNWQVEIWNIAPVAGVASRTGEALCKPNRSVSSLTGNPRLAEERFQAFRRTTLETLDAVLAQPASAESPILESLQSLGLRSFGAPGLSSVRERRLVLVSDLVQNTKRLSFIRGVPSYESFRVSADFDLLRAPISETRVDILYLSRPGAPVASALIEWWLQYFGAVGARILSVQRIVG